MHRHLWWFGLLVWICATGCFPHHPGPRLAHFANQAPQVGDPAVDFTLHDLGGNPVVLTDLIGEQPIMLQFGSHSCPVYRYRRFGMEKLIKKYQDRVRFLIVYTVEAHPVNSKSPYADKEWDVLWNRVVGVRVPQPEDNEARAELARYSHERLELIPEMVIDGMDNAVWEAYGGASSPAFVIDLEGRIYERQVWLEPKKIAEALDRLLAESDP